MAFIVSLLISDIGRLASEMYEQNEQDADCKK
jgi:hypothetical protein